jgi:hypothetical protein
MQFPSQKLLLLLTPRLPHCITSAVREDVAADVIIISNPSSRWQRPGDSWGGGGVCIGPVLCQTCIR